MGLFENFFYFCLFFYSRLFNLPFHSYSLFIGEHEYRLDYNSKQPTKKIFFLSLILHVLGTETKGLRALHAVLYV